MKRLSISILLAVLINGMPGRSSAGHGHGDSEDEGRNWKRPTQQQGDQGQQSPPQNQPFKKKRLQPSSPQAMPSSAPRREEHQARQGHWPLSPTLQSRGVTQAPHRFSKRAEIMNTERGRSSIPMPQEGFGGRHLGHSAISAKNFNGPIVREHMNFIGHSAAFSGPQISIQLHAETLPSHYYWHHDGRFDYTHYNDAWGYSWYGWYVGDSYFWTRYHSNRWWFYDDGFGRWNYWSDGSWYWQDPDSMSSVYIYDGGSYVLIN